MNIEMTPWSKSIEYTSPTGKETTLYSIGVLANALGRTTQTVRKWEIGGIIPPTPFKVQGHRFYSKEHIEKILESAEKSHIKQGKRVANTKFSERLYKDFDELYDYFFKEDET